MPTYTNTEKAKCAAREVAFRRHVYRAKVQAGAMTQEDADREVAVMEEIAADYRAAAGRDPAGPLFEGRG